MLPSSKIAHFRAVYCNNILVASTKLLPPCRLPHDVRADSFGLIRLAYLGSCVQKMLYAGYFGYLVFFCGGSYGLRPLVSRLFALRGHRFVHATSAASYFVHRCLFRCVPRHVPYSGRRQVPQHSLQHLQVSAIIYLVYFVFQGSSRPRPLQVCFQVHVFQHRFVVRSRAILFCEPVRGWSRGCFFRLRMVR